MDATRLEELKAKAKRRLELKRTARQRLGKPPIPMEKPEQVPGVEAAPPAPPPAATEPAPAPQGKQDILFPEEAKPIEAAPPTPAAPTPELPPEEESVLSRFKPLQALIRGGRRALGADIPVLAQEAGAIKPETAFAAREALRGGAEYTGREKEAWELYDKNKDNWAIPDFLEWAREYSPEIANLGFESLGASGIAQLAVGGVGAALGAPLGPGGMALGFAGGKLVASGIQEYVSTLQDSLADQGFDLNDAKSYNNAFANPEVMAKAREMGIKRGVPIGVIDGLTGVINTKGGGRMVVDAFERVLRNTTKEQALATTKRGVTREVADHIASATIDTAGAATGEVGAQVWSQGKITWPDVILEAGLEPVAAAPTIIAETAIGRYQQEGRAATEEELLQAGTIPGVGTPGGAPPEQFQTFNEAIAQGRTLVGIAQEGEGVTLVRPTAAFDPQTLEGQFGKIDPRKARMIAVAPNDPGLVMGLDDFVQNRKTLKIEDFTFDNADNEALARSRVTEALDPAQSDGNARLSFRNAIANGARIAPRAGGQAFFVGSPQGVSLKPTPTAIVPIVTRPGLHQPVDLLQVAEDPDVVLSHDFTKLAKKGDSRFEQVAEQTIEIKDPKLQAFKQGKSWTDFVEQLPKEMEQQGLVKPGANTSEVWGKAARAGLIKFNPSLAIEPGDIRVETYKGKDLTDKANFKEFSDKHGKRVSATVVESRQRPQIATLGEQYTFSAIPAQINDITVEREPLPSPEHERTIDAILKMYEKMKIQFGIDEDIVVVVGGSPAHALRVGQKYKLPTQVSQSVFDMTNFRGMFWAGDGHTTFIVLAGDNNPRQMYATALHEFGHLLAYSRFSKLPLREQADIFTAYKRFLAASDMSTQSRADHFIRRRKAPTPQQLSPNFKGDVAKDLTGKKSDYFLSFEEWFAEQVSRWGQTTRAPMSDMAKFFKSLAKQLLSLLKKLRQAFTGESFGAEPEMESWLTAMYTGEAKAEWGHVARRAGESQSAKVNAQYLGADTVPYQSETSHISKILGKYWAPTMGTGGFTPGGPQQPQTTNNSAAAVNAHLDKMGRFSKWFLNFRQVAARNPFNQPVQNFAYYLEQAQLDANRIMARAEERMRDFKDLRKVKGQIDALGGFLFDMTEMSYLTPQEVQRGVRRWPTQQEFNALVQRHGLSAEGLAVYRRIRGDFFASIDRMYDLRRRDAMQVSDPLLQLTALQQAVEMRDKLKASPYFPMSRFGRWAVTIRNANNEVEHFETFESQKEQKDAYKAAQTQYPAQQGFKHTMSALPEEVSQYQGMPQWYLDKLRSMPGMTRTQLDWIEQLRFELAPSASFKKHLIKRKNRKGYSKDIQRVYASYFFKDARHHARIKWAPSMNEEIAALRARHKLEGDVTKSTGPLGDYLEDLYREFANPTHDWAVMRSVAATWHLGASVASAALNMSQLPVMAYPFLASKFGELAAWKHMPGVMKDLTTFYKRGTYGQMTGAEFQAIDRAIKENLITESMAAELAATAQSGRLNVYGNPIGNFWNEITSKAMWMFQMTEQMNRRITFRATWRMAQENPGAEWLQEVKRRNFLEYQAMLASGYTDTDALSYLAGKQAIYDTMYDYSKAARPRFMRGRKGVLFTFYSFTQNTLFTLSQNKDMWVRYALVMTLLAGPMGLIPDDLEDVLNWIGRKYFGKQFSLERAARDLVAEVLGPNRPSWAQDLLLHGLGRYGFGIPALMDMVGVSWWPHFDRSKSVSLNRVLPLAVTSILEPGADYEKVLSDTVKDVAGAGFGLAFNVLEVLNNDELSWGDPKRWESALPRSIKGTVRAFRMGREGMERDRNYNEIVPFDTTDPEHIAELIGVALGYQPTRMSQIYDKMAAEREVQTSWTIQRSLLLREAYREYVVNRDTEAFNEVVKRIERFNESAPDKTLRISRDTIKRSFREREERRAKIKGGGLGSPGVRKQIEELYPEATAVEKVK